MNPADYPKSADADICLILEGTYPFLSGGVANWVYELIKLFPEYRFAAIFLGTKAEEYGDFRYPLAKNLVHLEAHYLFEDINILERRTEDISPSTMAKVESMHDKFKIFLTGEFDSVPELFEMMSDNLKVSKKQFLRSKSAWNLITNKYLENHSEQSFFDYFWTIRSLHRPFGIWLKL